jgi:hypothetical protein
VQRKGDNRGCIVTSITRYLLQQTVVDNGENIAVVYTEAQPPHNNLIYLSNIYKSRLRAHSPEHPLARAVSLLQPVRQALISSLYIPRSSKLVCVPARARLVSGTCRTNHCIALRSLARLPEHLRDLSKKRTHSRLHTETLGIIRPCMLS